MSDFYKLAAARLDRPLYDKLQQMAGDDVRSLSDEIRWLIDREWERRQNASTLIDTPAEYHADRPAQYITAQIPDLPQGE